MKNINPSDMFYNIKNFGKQTTQEELVSNGQLMQGEGYKCLMSKYITAGKITVKIAGDNVQDTVPGWEYILMKTNLNMAEPTYCFNFGMENPTGPNLSLRWKVSGNITLNTRLLTTVLPDYFQQSCYFNLFPVSCF